jgi:hypothetical protein
MVPTNRRFELAPHQSGHSARGSFAILSARASAKAGPKVAIFSWNVDAGSAFWGKGYLADVYRPGSPNQGGGAWDCRGNKDRPSARIRGSAATTPSMTHVWRHGLILTPIPRSVASPTSCRSNRTSSRSIYRNLDVDESTRRRVCSRCERLGRISGFHQSGAGHGSTTVGERRTSARY